MATDVTGNMNISTTYSTKSRKKTKRGKLMKKTTKKQEEPPALLLIEQAIFADRFQEIHELSDFERVLFQMGFNLDDILWHRGNDVARVMRAFTSLVGRSGLSHAAIQGILARKVTKKELKAAGVGRGYCADTGLVIHWMTEPICLGHSDGGFLYGKSYEKTGDTREWWPTAQREHFAAAFNDPYTFPRREGQAAMRCPSDDRDFYNGNIYFPSSLSGFTKGKAVPLSYKEKRSTSLDYKRSFLDFLEEKTGALDEMNLFFNQEGSRHCWRCDWVKTASRAELDEYEDHEGADGEECPHCYDEGTTRHYDAGISSTEERILMAAAGGQDWPFAPTDNRSLCGPPHIRDQQPAADSAMPGIAANSAPQ